MVTLAQVIRELLDDGESTPYRLLRSLQLIHWISSGGSTSDRFREASGIFAAAYLVRLGEKPAYSNLTVMEKLQLGLSSDVIKLILSECRKSSFLYDAISTGNVMLIQDKDTICRTLKPFAEYYKIQLQYWSLEKTIVSFNKIDKLKGGRSTQTALRSRYQQQASFIFAFLQVDESYVSFVDPSEKPVKADTSPQGPVDARSLIRALLDRLKNNSNVQVLQYAKAALPILDPKLANELEDAWLNLEPADLRLPRLEDHELDILKPAKRHRVEERRSTNRQVPNKPGGPH